MRDLSADTLTEAVIAAVQKSESDRLREISTALIKYLHAFVNEIGPTQAEWWSAVRFLTACGQKCTDTRQEFVLLSDTLGASMLVDGLVHANDGTSTETTVLGPFYVEHPTEFPLGSDISGALPGQPLFVDGSVLSSGGEPVSNAIVDIWHASADGLYDVQHEGTQMHGGRARLRTDAQGRFHFWTIKPSSYPIPDDGPVGDMLRAQGRHPYRPGHVHFMIAADGHETLTTHIFIAGDQYLDSDVVFGVKGSIIADFVEYQPGATIGGRTTDQACFHLHYNFRLLKTT